MVKSFKGFLTVKTMTNSAIIRENLQFYVIIKSFTQGNLTMPYLVKININIVQAFKEIFVNEGRGP